MSTRSLIARKTESGWEGIYHHWDGYPDALGATLFELFNGHFDQDVSTMLAFLLDEHRGGWSTINDKDFTKDPGFDGEGPSCYCHGSRSEGPYDLIVDTGEDMAGAEYCYVIDPKTSVITVLKRVYDDGRHAVSAFGIDAGVGPKRVSWRQIEQVPLFGPEPNWQAM